MKLAADFLTWLSFLRSWRVPSMLHQHFFDFLAFEVFSAWVSGLVCAGAADCSIGKPQTQRAQAAIPWHKTVTLFRCIG